MNFSTKIFLIATISLLGLGRPCDGLLLKPTSSGIVLKPPISAFQIPPRIRRQGGGGGTSSSKSSSALSAVITPMTAAKIATGMMGVSTTISTLAPSKNLEIFGFESNKMSDLIMMEIGAVGHSLFVMLYLQLFQSMPFLTAAGYHFVPYLYKNLHCHLNRKFKDSGSPNYFGPVSTAVALLTTLSCFYSANSGAINVGEIVLKAFSLVTCLKGLAVIFSPRKFLKDWKSSPSSSEIESEQESTTTKTTETNIHMLHLMGWTWLARGIFLGMQAWKRETTTPIQALGYMMATFTASVVSPSLFSKKYDKLGIPKGKFLAYLVFGAVITAALILSPFKVQ